VRRELKRPSVTGNAAKKKGSEIGGEKGDRGEWKDGGSYVTRQEMASSCALEKANTPLPNVESRIARRTDEPREPRRGPADDSDCTL